MRILNQCMHCIHYEPDFEDPEAHASCAAFPGGIPFEIWEDGRDHRFPFLGDNGIRFEPTSDANQAILARWDQ